LCIGAAIGSLPGNHAPAQQEADPRVADLVRAGTVRIGLFAGQYSRDPATGQPKGVWADVARAFAARVGVRLVLVEHPTPPRWWSA
jgi:ABC-type amino acid transport substrate-binding protein